MAMIHSADRDTAITGLVAVSIFSQPPPEEIPQVIYTGPGGDILPPGGGPITITFPDQSALDEWVVEQFEGRPIYFILTERGPQGYLQVEMSFTITGSGSYVVIGDDPPTPLSIGDGVRLRFRPGGTMDAIGDGKDDFRLYINDGPGISGNDLLTDCWITGFEDFTTTLTFRVGGGTEHTRLIINNETCIDEDNGGTFIFSDIRPGDPTPFVLEFPPNLGAGQPVLSVGNASAITRNGVLVHP
ncbi:MAG: hypothetical protein ACXQTN_04720 [Methanoculleaceae archaeon]